MDRPPRKPGRLSHAPQRQKISSPLRRADGVRHQPRSAVARRRGLPAPHSVQDSDQRSEPRAFHSNLRAELPEPQPPVPPGDGRVPAAAPLRAEQPADARVPSARPDRSGHRDVPLSRARAGDHARAARRGMPHVLRGRRPVAAGRAVRPGEEIGAAAAGHSLMTKESREICSEFVARAVVGSLFALLSINLVADFAHTHRATGLLLLASESLVVVLTIVRRRARLVDRSAQAAVATAVSLVGPSLLRVSTGAGMLPDTATLALSAVGLIVVISGKL